MSCLMSSTMSLWCVVRPKGATVFFAAHFLDEVAEEIQGTIIMKRLEVIGLPVDALSKTKLRHLADLQCDFKKFC